MTKNITSTEYTGIEGAFNFMNNRLFGDQLPECLITLQRKASAAGYHWHNSFKSRNAEDEKTTEIALNPDIFPFCTDKEILQTLAHEMCHLWQYRYGKVSRAGYHNREWAEKMESIGLVPSSTGKPGGKRTGQNMDDYIFPGGQFETVVNELLEGGFTINWESSSIPRKIKGGKGKKRDEISSIEAAPPTRNPKNKVKYTCECGVNVWGKPGLNIVCGDCQQPFIDVDGTTF